MIFEKLSPKGNASQGENVNSWSKVSRNEI
jgi:hypothetical protein